MYNWNAIVKALETHCPSYDLSLGRAINAALHHEYENLITQMHFLLDCPRELCRKMIDEFRIEET